MSHIVAIVGESGSGKTTSIRNLNPKTTVILSPITKPLPFKSKDYNAKNKNYFSDANAGMLLSYMQNISDKAPQVKTIIIDDFQYLMSVEFMSRAKETGYTKFTDIGQNAYNVITKAARLRDDIVVFFLGHEEQSEVTGKRKIKTIGKMLDDKITLEGLFTTVLFTSVENGKYDFVTQSDGTTTAKSPMGMLDLTMENDLKLVQDKLIEYYE